MEIFEKCLSLLFSLMILGNAYLVRKTVGSWLFPACIYSLFWFGYTFFPLLILFEVPCNPFSIAFILLTTIVFSFSSLSFNWKFALTRNELKLNLKPTIYYNLFLKLVFYISVLLAITFLIINSLIQGISIYNLIFNLFESAAQYTIMRYAEEIKVNVYSQLSYVLSYFALTIGGLLFSYAKSKKERWIILIAAFFPSLFLVVTQSAKGSLFLSIVLFWAGTLVNRIFRNERSLFRKGSLKFIIITFIIIIPVIAISFLSRGISDPADSDFIIDKLRSSFASYSFGHIYAFSDWFSFYIGKPSILNYTNEETTYGFYTFMAIFKTLGSSKTIPLGVFDDYYSYKELVTTNIFSMYRGLVQDFGIIGTFIFMYLQGVLLHLAFYIMLIVKKPTFTIAVFIFMLGYFYHSFLISLLNSNSIYISFILLYLILLCNKYIYIFTLRNK